MTPRSLTPSAHFRLELEESYFSRRCSRLGKYTIVMQTAYTRRNDTDDIDDVSSPCDRIAMAASLAANLPTVAHKIAVITNNTRSNLQFSCLAYRPTRKLLLFTDRISEGGNSIASVRPSVRLLTLYLRNRLTADLELLRVSRSRR